MSSLNRKAKDRRRIRQYLFDLQDGRCFYCDEQMFIMEAGAGVILPCNNNPRQATFEHLVKRSNGGADGGGNVVLACRECNNMRFDADHEPFKARMRAERRL